MALVRGIDASRPRRAIARGVLQICRELGIRVLAEGIENSGERDFFRHHGVTLIQGYLSGRPALQATVDVDPRAWPARL